MTAKILEKIAKSHSLTPIDAGDFATLKASGMTFKVEAYYAEGLGQVSLMRASGFFGLMKMDTLIINPTELDLPLYSYDRIFAMGNDTLIVELYDTLLGEYSEAGMQSAKSDYTDLAERDPGEHWYDSIKLASSISKKGGKKDTARLNALTLSHFDAYLASSNAPVTDGAAKRDKASVYVEGLLEKGGPSTDVFKKTLGDAKTAQLFRNILFGTHISAEG